eukprot:GHVN01051413.1.p1 GENE.GHVN01051413.1~~GHVN01051413.1.p1  ORF type:complete len:1561 (-),score=364.17 GHVN01051413.1:525-4928(-)
MNLTFPETVTKINIHEMKALVARGPHKWPGAKNIIREDGTRFDLRHCPGAVQQIEVGYRVERHMQDGDFVLFNRQPSLHKMSIMGHRVKVLPWSTFRLNLSVTSPYNADFDGDEMNLHLPQSHETRAETKHLMLVPRQVVSPQGNRPVMGIVQDSLIGVCKFTKRDTFLDKKMVMNLVLWIPYWDGTLPIPAIIRPTPLWTGKQIVTMILSFERSTHHGEGRTHINLERDAAIRRRDDNENLSDNDGRVIIRDNEHLAGVICKRTAGASNGSLVHVLWHDAGPERAKDFLSNTQRVINYWLLQVGFTTGCADIVTDKETTEKMADSIAEAKEQVSDIIGQAREGALNCQPGKSLFESFEARVNQTLNTAREKSGGTAADFLDERNNIIAMVNSGSKGSTINLSQIVACVGQQNVEGKRIPFGFKDRTLPHFVKHDYGPESRGFVENSYLSGLTPSELFFHAMAGREGIIDTAVKTSETGYIQRRLMKAMEDVMVAYDRTVRSSTGDIVQFLYGEDGMAGEYIEDQSIELLILDHDKLSRAYEWQLGDGDSIDVRGLVVIKDETVRRRISYHEKEKQPLKDEFMKLKEAKEKLCVHVFADGETRQHLPVNVARLIQIAKLKFTHDEQCDPTEIVRKVESLLESLQVAPSAAPTSHTSLTEEAAAAQLLLDLEVRENSTELLRAHLRTALASRKLMEADDLGKGGLTWLLGAIQTQFYKSLAHPGEVVGALAAQSIGEPATQMTLNTFHFAGVGSKNVTLGVPRLKELINVVKNVKTPTLTVYLEPKYALDQALAKDIQTLLEHTKLETIASHAQVIYDPDPVHTIVKEDQEWVSDYYELPDEEINPDGLRPWVLRIEFVPSLVTDKQLDMRGIGEKVRSKFGADELELIWTDDNSDQLVVRVRLRKQAEEDDAPKQKEEHYLLRNLMSLWISQITLKGVQGITKVYMREERLKRYNQEKGKFEVDKSNWMLDTDGVNLAAVLAIDEIDSAKTISNDILEVLSVLGIEAARRVLLYELRRVISFDGSYVNYRHLSMLCDVMTQDGRLMPITRNGMNRVARGPLVKSTFEETVEMLTQAAMFAEIDELRGVSENVMLGQLGRFGTGQVDLLIDETKLLGVSSLVDHVTGDVVKTIDGVDSTTVSGLALSVEQAHSPRDFATSPLSPSMRSQVYSSPFSPASGDTALTKMRGYAFSPHEGAMLSPTSPYAQHSPRSSFGCFSSPNHTTSASVGLSSNPPTNPSHSSPLYTPQSPMGDPPSSRLGSSSALMHTGSSGLSVTSPNPHSSSGYGSSSPHYSDGRMSNPSSPYYQFDHTSASNLSPHSPGIRSPQSPGFAPHSFGGGYGAPLSPAVLPGAYDGSSSNYSAQSPSYYDSGSPGPLNNPTSPRYNPASPGAMPFSPLQGPESPGAPLSPRDVLSPTAPLSPTSPLSPGGITSPSRYDPRQTGAYSPIENPDAQLQDDELQDGDGEVH